MPSTRHTPAVKVWTAWLLVGVVASLSLQWAQASALGGWSGLIATSAESPMRPVVERELGNVTLLPSGHDGQFSFLMAVDPFNRQNVGALFDDAPYRYRRILYPLLAGGAGLLPGKATLVGLIVLAALGVGLATASTATFAGRLGISRWVVAAVLANPGVWLGAQLLTSDALALGLALTALVLWWDRRLVWATVLFGLAALAKDQYLLVGLAVAGWSWFRGQRRQAMTVAAGSTAPLGLWVLWVSSAIGNGVTVRGNLAFLGLLDASHLWSNTVLSDQILIGFALVGVILAIVLPWKAGSLFRWLAWPWVALALASSAWVWTVGNNAARVFALLWVFSGLSLGVWLRSRHAPETPPELG
jgi:hypothetical protein